MKGKHVVLAVLIGISILHLITDGEATVKLLKQWK